MHQREEDEGNHDERADWLMPRVQQDPGVIPGDGETGLAHPLRWSTRARAMPGIWPGAGMSTGTRGDLASQERRKYRLAHPPETHPDDCQCDEHQEVIRTQDEARSAGAMVTTDGPQTP